MRWRRDGNVRKTPNRKHTMKRILEKYLGEEIGINYDKPFKIDDVTLVGVEADYFSITDHDKGYTHHFTYQSIVQIIEHEGGVDVGGLFTHHKHHTVVLKVGHVMEYIPG